MKQFSNSLKQDETVYLSEENVIPDKITRKDAEITTSRGKSKLEESLTSLVQLIANITESYTASIFVADPKNNILHSLAYQSLSRDFIENAQIPFGAGLVGWTATNKVRIAVCPFEHDSRTLLYYKTDQALKSFIAVPILSKNGDLVGVIACDSKKGYAFPKLAEKLLTDCAVQANLLIELHLANDALTRNKEIPLKEEKVESFISTLSEATTEEDLFLRIQELPGEYISRDAILSLVLSKEGYGDPSFYANAKDKRMEQHIIDLACKQKRLAFKGKSIHVLPAEDIRARTFVSVPVCAFEREVGCLNILSKPFKAFSSSDIEVLELLGKTASKELERIRARSLSSTRQIGPSMLSWSHFLKKASLFIDSNKNQDCGFLRMGLAELAKLEGLLGVQVLSNAHEQLLRFIQQLSTHPLFVSAPYGTSIFIFGDKRLLEALHSRVLSLMSKIDSSSLLLPGMQFGRGTGEILANHIGANLILLKKGASYSETALDEFITRSLNGASPAIQAPVETPIAQVEVKVQQQEIVNETIRNPREQKPSTEDLIRGSIKKRPEENAFTMGEAKLNTKEKFNAKFW